MDDEYLRTAVDERNPNELASRRAVIRKELAENQISFRKRGKL